MDKHKILSEIRRITAESDGKAPGYQRFSSETGLRKSDWYPKLWLRWGDAIVEAGCQPNKFNKAFEADELIRKYIELIRELEHFPIDGELKNKAREDKTFPSHTAFRQLGNKQERLRKIIEYCDRKNEFEDIITCCEKVSSPQRKKSGSLDVGIKTVGYVYLLKHGSRNEYKIGRTNNQLRREGEIRLELPEEIKPIHYIETDDPAGIEHYWHSRFKSKRMKGEWFTLTLSDVQAFKRWRKIY